MFMRSYLLSIAVIPIVIAHAQPISYQSRGAASYLVNYWAIRGNPFAARFAANRFSLIDEGSRIDIELMHGVKPALPVLHYKDVVALGDAYPEYRSMDRIEDAFLHSADPASLVAVERNDTVWCAWLQDRRSEATQNFTVYCFMDSLSPSGVLVAQLNARMKASFPRQGAFVQVFSEMDTGIAVPYSGRVRIQSMNDETPYVYAASIDKAFSIDDPLECHIAVTAGVLGSTIPDSVIAVMDFNRDNRLDTLRERMTMKRNGTAWQKDTVIMLPPDTHGGYEFVLYAYRHGQRYRAPARGIYGTNVNNRLMNDYYGFFVMDPGHPAWRTSYINEVVSACARDGYRGLFEDDCWYRLESWQPDAYPPIDYDEFVWRANLFRFMDSVRNALHPYPVYFNGLYSTVSDSLLLHADGGMTEGFAYTHWSNYVTGDSWRLQCDLGLKAQHQYRRSWLALGGAPRTDSEGRLYVLGSYLLAADSLSIYANATSYQEFSHFPEFDVPLGAPLSTAVAAVDELKRTQGTPSRSYYVREFEHGTVVVNPNAAGVVAFDAGGRARLAVDTLTTIDGGRITSRTTAAVDTIAPHSARIYLGRAGAESPRLCSPEILSMRVSPNPAPSDGVTPVIIEVELRDSSSQVLMADPSLPLYVVADCGAFGGPSTLLLRNDGAAASTIPSIYRGSCTITIGAPPSTTAIPILAHSTTGLVTVGQTPMSIRSADSTNLVLNYSYEIDNDHDGIPDLWRPYVKGFDYDTAGVNKKSGTRSVHVRNDSLSEFRGVLAFITLNQSVPGNLELSGWSKALNVSGTKGNDYALYVDARYTDGTPLYGQTAQFNTGTHDWEYASRIITPAKPIRDLTLYALFRFHSGEAWFDHLALRPAPASEVLPAISSPDRPQLGAVFPAPASGTIVIPVTIPCATHLRLEVLDVLGRRLALLEDRDDSAGSYPFRFDVSGLPEGSYVVRMTTRSGVVQRRFVVTK
jgi:hypothetical protein